MVVRISSSDDDGGVPKRMERNLVRSYLCEPRSSRDVAALLVSPLDLRILTIVFFLLRSGSSFGPVPFSACFLSRLSRLPPYLQRRTPLDSPPPDRSPLYPVYPHWISLLGRRVSRECPRGMVLPARGYSS
ncbi:hypothetical protein NDU88_002596 [Pleurodeles waltl]|uniref:Uncharacterized protein n=1 Tax=Pleurodeles waltl TaxID=8319 RepID=A0AAV7UW35_PLEWA|nr:hypothetical protein NDU88_002596 [Pleurodeles waltl]